MDSKSSWPQWVTAVALAVAGLALLSMLASSSTQPNLAYSDFRKLVDQHKVDNLVLTPDTITGTVAPNGLAGLVAKQQIEEMKRLGGGRDLQFVTTRVEDPTLVPALEAEGIRFSARGGSKWLSTAAAWILPLLLMFGLWALFARQFGGGGGVMNLGKSRARVYVEQRTGVMFDEVAGIEDARGELVEIIDFLRFPQRYERLGGRIPKGVLLVGPPGTGKTLLARAVAGEAKVPFFSLSGSEFVEMFVGVGAARVRDLFAQAQAKAPCIIFIDELDALGKARGVSPAAGGQDEREQTLNQMLAELDGFDGRKGIIVLGATNRPEILDPALLRPGRFDRQVVIDRPDVRGREKILRVHARHVRMSDLVDLATIAARTPGLVGADLANLVNEAALHAARRGKMTVENDDFEEALDRVVAGLARKSRVISSREKEIVAHHEAGHALIAEVRPHADRVSKVSLIPRGVASLGHTQQLPAEDRYLLTKAELLDRLDVMLGGRVAEEIVFGDVSTGAEDDLRRATDLARQMAAQFGMGEGIGLAHFDGARRPHFLDVLPEQERTYSEQTAERIDAEIERMLEAAHARVRDTLLARRTTLEQLAKLLLDHEVVDRSALTHLLAA